MSTTSGSSPLSGTPADGSAIDASTTSTPADSAVTSPAPAPGLKLAWRPGQSQKPDPTPADPAGTSSDPAAPAAPVAAPAAPVAAPAAPAGFGARLVAAATALRGGAPAPAAAAAAPAAAPAAPAPASRFHFTPVKWIMGAVGVFLALLLLWSVVGLVAWRSSVTGFYSRLFYDVTSKTPAEVVEAREQAAKPALDPAKVQSDTNAITALRAEIDGMKPQIGKAASALEAFLATGDNAARAELHFPTELTALAAVNPPVTKDALDRFHRSLDELETRAGQEGVSTAINAVRRNVEAAREDLDTFNSRYTNRLAAFERTLSADRTAAPTVDPVAEKAARDAEAERMRLAELEKQKAQRLAEIAPFAGRWFNAKYGLGLEIKLDDQGNPLGVCTVTNSGKYGPGATLFTIEEIRGNVCYGKHQFANGWYRVYCRLTSDGRLEFGDAPRNGEMGSGNDPWFMDRQ